MTRRGSDPWEYNPYRSPLFARNDPPTSRRAAETKKASGTISKDADLLLSYIERFPGYSIPGLAALAASERGGSLEFWRQKLGRRAADLKRACKAGTRGTENTEHKQKWWPGADPS